MTLSLIAYQDTPVVILTTSDFDFTVDRQYHYVAGWLIGMTSPFVFDKVTQNREQGLVLEGQKFIWGLWLTSMVAVEKEVWDWRHGGKLDLADFTYTVLGYTVSYSLNRLLKYALHRPQKKKELKIIIEFIPLPDTTSEDTTAVDLE